MSSLEMADLCEKRHDNVRRVIEMLADKSIIVRPQIEDEPETDAMGRIRTTKVYHVEKRDSYVVVAQLSPEFTARLVDRWQELEKRASDPMAILSDPAAMRGLLLTYTEKVIALQGEVEAMRPHVEALSRIAVSDGSLCITDAAKTLQLRPKDVFAYLRHNAWIYSRGGSGESIAYQNKLQSGLLEHKVTMVSRTDGTERSTTQVRVTPKGLARLAEAFGDA